MRLLITGLGGFVGQHLKSRLQVRFPDCHILPGIPDIRDAQAVNDSIANGRPDCCIHLAAISTIGKARQSPDDTWAVNLQGTLNLARAMLKHVPDGTFFFASTAEAYGTTFQCNRPLNEDAALSPANTYAATKAAADLALGAMARDGLRAIRMRPFNHTGPGQSPDFVVPAFASQIARIAKGLQKPQIHVGNLDAQRDFLDVRDVCDAYLDVLEHRMSLQPGTIFNVCAGQTRSIRSILDDLMDLSSVQAEIMIDPDRLRPSDIPVASGDASRFRSALGWAPRITWSQTLNDIYEDRLKSL